MPVHAQAPAIPLTKLRRGDIGVVAEAKLDAADAAMLRAMGLCEQVTVRLCRAGEPCIVAVGGLAGLGADADEHCGCGKMRGGGAAGGMGGSGGCRIGLTRPLAERIFVTVRA